MPWFKEVMLEEKQVLFTNTRNSDGSYAIKLSIRADDFGGKSDIVCLDVERSDKPIPFTTLLALSNPDTTRQLINKYIKPYLSRLQCN